MSKDLTDQQKAELESKIRDARGKTVLYCNWVPLDEPRPRPHATFRYRCGRTIGATCRLAESNNEKQECARSRGKEKLTLQDVLIAWIAKVDEAFHPDEPEKRDHKYQWGTHKILGKYDLTKGYHHQSEEFYVFLHSLLCDEV